MVTKYDKITMLTRMARGDASDLYSKFKKAIMSAWSSCRGNTNEKLSMLPLQEDYYPQGAKRLQCR
jgi:hypothetical protein